jgi:hypothetical protein
MPVKKKQRFIHFLKVTKKNYLTKVFVYKHNISNCPVAMKILLT